MARAVEVYNDEVEKGSKKGLRQVCQQVMNECRDKTGRSITLNYNTLNERVKGRKSLGQSNSEKSWLSKEETDSVIEYALEVADRGFPLSHKRLKEHVDEIIRGRLGPSFPGVGENWTDRFLTKHSDRLGTYWAHSLDSARGRAVNPANKTKFFNLLGECIEKFNIEEDCVWAADETGIQASAGTKERVVGGAGKKTQHAQGDGNRENITVMVTICADGSSIPPAVIFKGKAFLTKWKQENPTKAS